MYKVPSASNVVKMHCVDGPSPSSLMADREQVYSVNGLTGAMVKLTVVEL